MSFLLNVPLGGYFEDAMHLNDRTCLHKVEVLECPKAENL